MQKQPRPVLRFSFPPFLSHYRHILFLSFPTLRLFSLSSSLLPVSVCLCFCFFLFHPSHPPPPLSLSIYLYFTLPLLLPPSIFPALPASSHPSSQLLISPILYIGAKNTFPEKGTQQVEAAAESVSWFRKCCSLGCRINSHKQHLLIRVIGQSESSGNLVSDG